MEFLKKHTFFLILFALVLICLYFSTGVYANLYLDVGREMYYPLAILDGNVLYKDIFCIYGPFSYLLNALGFKIFGAKLTTLYIFGTVSAASVVCLIYFISRYFFQKIPSFIIAFFVLATGCLATRIFNFTLPYSYAMLYGLVCFLISIYCLLNFFKIKKQYLLVLSGVFLGFSVANKYDFILCLIPFLIAVFYNKNPKLAIKAFLAFILALCLPFAFLFFQGLQIQDLINTFIEIKKFSSTKALQIFYSTQGVFYTNKVWEVWTLVLLTKTFFFFAIYSGFVLFSKNKYFGTIVILIFAVLNHLYTSDVSYLPLTFLTFILFAFTFKKHAFVENIFVLSVLLLSMKSFWGLSHTNYGLYYVGLMLVSFFILIPKKFFNTALVFFASMALSFALINSKNIISQNVKINTEKGILKTYPKQAEMTNKILDFVNNIKEDSPKVAIFPEGLNINFLSTKKTIPPMKYNSLIPLYTEAFGEDIIIDYYKKFKADYIIFYSYEMKSYGRGAICETYAFDFCSFVGKNYDLLENNKDFMIYKNKRL